MNLLETVEKGLENAGKKVLVGLSGGPDSVALLHALLALRKKLDMQVCAAHLNHGIRAEAEADERFARELCAAWGVEFFSRRVDVPTLAKQRGWTIEQAAREARYEFLEEIRQGANAQGIAVAHHMEDQAETVIMHLLRGSGLNGLCGMAGQNGFLIRPLLGVRRAQIMDYINEHKLSYRTDESNLSPEYARNRVRLELMPALLEYNPNFVEAACAMAGLLQADKEFLGAQSDAEFRRLLLEDGALQADGVLALPKALSSRVIMLAMNRAGLTSDIEKKHVDAVLALLGGQTGSEVSLPGGLCARISYGKLYIGAPLSATEEFELPLELPGDTQLPGGFTLRCTFIERAPDDLKSYGASVAHANRAALLGATVRTRRPGDVIKTFGGGTKRLKEYFIDEKVPREKRAMPLICIPGEVLWIPGLALSERLRVKSGEAAVKLEFFKEEQKNND